MTPPPPAGPGFSIATNKPSAPHRTGVVRTGNVLNPQCRSTLQRLTTLGPNPRDVHLATEATTGIVTKGTITSHLRPIHIEPNPRSNSHVSHRLASGPPGNTNPGHPGRGHHNRYISAQANTEVITRKLDALTLEAVSSHPFYSAGLAKVSGIQLDKPVLPCHQPPLRRAYTEMPDLRREHAHSLYTERGKQFSNRRAATNKSRRFPTAPERVLDAPGMMDDFYLNLISWSALNTVAVALGEHTYTWRADTGDVDHVAVAPENSYVSSLDFSRCGTTLGIGMGTGDLELWDLETKSRLRTLPCHRRPVLSLSWKDSHTISAAGDRGAVWDYDIRGRGHVVKRVGHRGLVCGLKWNPDGRLLASGGSDSIVNIWDARTTKVILAGEQSEASVGGAKWTKRDHTAAVKALSWCRWQTSLLASGGGISDATIRIWNTTTGALSHSVKTPSQVTTLHWSVDRKELLSTHGSPCNSIAIHSYPTLDPVTEIQDAHESRLLFSALSPEGDVVVTGASDENLKFWRVWCQKIAPGTAGDTIAHHELPGIVRVSRAKTSTKSGLLSIR